MNTLQARRLINSISSPWGKKWKKFIYFVLEVINDNPYKDLMSSNFFEFSTESFQKEIGLLHLNFYNEEAPYDIVNTMKQQRKSVLFNILEILNKQFRNKYNLDIAEAVLNLNNDNSWPMQFGMDLNGRGRRVKLYSSLILSESRAVLDKIESIADKLKLNKKNIVDRFFCDNFDALGFDFINNGSVALKIYTFYESPFNFSLIKKLYCKKNNTKNKLFNSYFDSIQKMPLRHIGFLYRISNKSKIDSIKIWARFNNPVPFNSFSSFGRSESKFFQNWLSYAGKIIKAVKAKISYLTLENNKLGVYFR